MVPLHVPTTQTFVIYRENAARSTCTDRYICTVILIYVLLLFHVSTANLTNNIRNRTNSVPILLSIFFFHNKHFWISTEIG